MLSRFWSTTSEQHDHWFVARARGIIEGRTEIFQRTSWNDTVELVEPIR